MSFPALWKHRMRPFPLMGLRYPRLIQRPRIGSCRPTVCGERRSIWPDTLRVFFLRISAVYFRRIHPLMDTYPLYDWMRLSWVRLLVSLESAWPSCSGEISKNDPMEGKFMQLLSPYPTTQIPQSCPLFAPTSSGILFLSTQKSQ